MKYSSIICVVALLVSVFSLLEARPVMVAVGLNDKKDIEQWVQFDFPTYEFIHGTAIAEIDDTQLIQLNEHGFTYEIIDDQPWSNRYYMCNVPPRYSALVPGRVIWDKNQTSIIKVPVEDIARLYSLKLRFQPLRRVVLPRRFWDAYLKTVVSMRSLEWDPFVQSIVDEVSTDSITAYIQRLEDFKSRLALGDSSFAASQWLWDKLTNWGYTPEFDSFYVDTTMAAWGSWPDTGYERNVIATLNGSDTPSQSIIICGHFDAIVWWDTALARISAPGADDNASGTVAALEAARIFKDYSWEPSMKFVGWAVEELGLYGSYHYAGRADSLDEDIGGVVNLDMIGYMDDADYDCIIQRRDNVSLWLSDLFHDAGQLYVPSLLIYPTTSSGGSDWYPFALYGYPAVGGAENAGSHWNPYYHDTSDVLSTLDPVLYTMITKVSVATIAILGSYPGVVEDVVAYDMGEGSSLQINWSPSPYSDVVGYNVYWGRQSGVYTDTHFVAAITQTVDTLTGLLTDTTYYIAVTAVDDDDHESYAAVEVTGVPRIVPLAPSSVEATPIIAGIRIDWASNTELDLDGYRVYRRIDQDTLFDSLNTLLLKDTTFTNAPLSGEHKYYYTIRTFDTGGNFSPMSEEVYGRPITMDQGILIVDETRSGGGPNPSDSLQDEFYHDILNGYNYTDYEFSSLAERPAFADLVPYSSVLWHGDDYTQLMAAGSIEDLGAYLGIGGNLWFVGWKPTANLSGSITYPADYTPGSFIYDNLKISHVELSGADDAFQAAIGNAGFPQLDVDSVKVLVPSWGGTLRMIEAFTTISPADEVYTIDMVNNGSPFEGEVCGVRYLGPDDNCVLFGFPLYYMEQEQARAVAQKVMTDFGELAVAERPTVSAQASQLLLQQNSPNPSRGQTSITYQIPHAGEVSLRVYDIIGQLVKTLVNEPQNPGVYRVNWNGEDDRGRQASSGVYFYQLQVNGQSRIKKMVLLR